MKQYKNKEYEGKWEHKTGYRKHYQKKTYPYSKKTTYPWKNPQKSIHST